MWGNGALCLFHALACATVEKLRNASGTVPNSDLRTLPGTRRGVYSGDSSG